MGSVNKQKAKVNTLMKLPLSLTASPRVLDVTMGENSVDLVVELDRYPAPDSKHQLRSLPSCPAARRPARPSGWLDWVTAWPTSDALAMTALARPVASGWATKESTSGTSSSSMDRRAAWQ